MSFIELFTPLRRALSSLGSCQEQDSASAGFDAIPWLCFGPRSRAGMGRSSSCFGSNFLSCKSSAAMWR